MRRVAALLAIASILACAGGALPCRGGETSAAVDSCCDPDGAASHGGCPPGPDCPCCPQLRPALPVMEVACVLPSEDQVLLTTIPAEFRPSPDPREILHVPKAEPSFG